MQAQKTPEAPKVTDRFSGIAVRKAFKAALDTMFINVIKKLTRVYFGELSLRSFATRKI